MFCYLNNNLLWGSKGKRKNSIPFFFIVDKISNIILKITFPPDVSFKSISMLPRSSVDCLLKQSFNFVMSLLVLRHMIILFLTVFDGRREAFKSDARNWWKLKVVWFQWFFACLTTKSDRLQRFYRALFSSEKSIFSYDSVPIPKYKRVTSYDIFSIFFFEENRKKIHSFVKL